jgi:hypothetical protein
MYVFGGKDGLKDIQEYRFGTRTWAQVCGSHTYTHTHTLSLSLSLSLSQARFDS